MPLLPAERLSPHFTAYELGADKPEANAVVIANLRRLAADLETVRAVLGNGRLQVNTAAHRNRGFRTADALPNDSPTTSHDDGDAADFVPLDFSGSKLTAHRLLENAKSQGRLPPFDQIIYYPIQGHIHYGRGPRLRGEFRIYMYEGRGGTPLVSVDNIRNLGAAVGTTVSAFVSANPLVSLLIVAVITVYLASTL